MLLALGLCLLACVPFQTKNKRFFSLLHARSMIRPLTTPIHTHPHHMHAGPAPLLDVHRTRRTTPPKGRAPTSRQEGEGGGEKWQTLGPSTKIKHTSPWHLGTSLKNKNKKPSKERWRTTSPPVGRPEHR